MRLALFLAGSLILGGCVEPGSSGEGFRVDTLSDGTIQYDNAPENPGMAVGWGVAETFTVGARDDGSDLEFGRIRGLALDEKGHLYVLDSMVPVIRVFDPDGVHVLDIGSEGDGPGEFRNPGGVVLSDQALWVRDYPTRRYIAFELDGGVRGTYRRAFGGLQWQSWSGSDGRLWERVSLPKGDRLVPALLQVMPEDGEMLVTDTLHLPEVHDVEQWEVEFHEVSPGVAEGGPIPVPFAREARHDVDPNGGIWTGITNERRFVHRDEQGVAVRQIVRTDMERVPVTAENMERAIERLRERYGEALQVDRQVVPDYMPFWDAMFVDGREYLWIRHFHDTDSEGPTTWDVYDRQDGRFLGTLDLPPYDPDRIVSTGHRLAGVVTDDLGVESVLVLELAR